MNRLRRSLAFLMSAMAVGACASATESNADVAMSTTSASSDEKDISSSTTTTSTTTTSTTTTAPPPAPNEVLQQWKIDLAMKQCPREVSDALDSTVSTQFNEWCRAVVEFDEWLLENDTRIQVDFPGSNLCDSEDAVELDGLSGIRKLLVREFQNDCIQLDLDLNAEKPEQILRASATNSQPKVSYAAGFQGSNICGTEGKILTIGSTYFIYGSSEKDCFWEMFFTVSGTNPIPAIYPVTCPFEAAVVGGSASSCKTGEVDGGFVIGADRSRDADNDELSAVPGSILDDAKFMIFGELDEGVFVHDLVGLICVECPSFIMVSFASDAIAPSWFLESYSGSKRIPSNEQLVTTQDCSDVEDSYVARFGTFLRLDETTTICTTLVWDDLLTDSRMTDDLPGSCAAETWSIDALVKGVFGTCLVTSFDVYQFDSLTGTCSFLAEIPPGPNSSSQSELVWIDGTTTSTKARCTVDPRLDNDDLGIGRFVASGTYEYENRLGGVNSVPRLIALVAFEVEDR